MQGPTKERFEGLYGALVVHRTNQLAVVRDAKTGRRSLDQSTIKWSPIVQQLPEVGESSRDF
jgi:hypothetical protein